MRRGMTFEALPLPIFSFSKGRGGFLIIKGKERAVAGEIICRS